MNALLSMSKKFIGSPNGAITDSPKRILASPFQRRNSLQRSKSCNFEELHTARQGSACKLEVEKPSSMEKIFNSNGALHEPTSDTEDLDDLIGQSSLHESESDSRALPPLTGHCRARARRLDGHQSLSELPTEHASGNALKQSRRRGLRSSYSERNIRSEGGMSDSTEEQLVTTSRRQVMRDQARRRQELRRGASRRHFHPQRRRGMRRSDFTSQASDDNESIVRRKSRHRERAESDHHKSTKSLSCSQKEAKKNCQDRSERSRRRTSDNNNRRSPNRRRSSRRQLGETSEKPIKDEIREEKQSPKSEAISSQSGVNFSSTVLAQLLAQEGLSVSDDLDYEKACLKKKPDPCLSPNSKASVPPDDAQTQDLSSSESSSPVSLKDSGDLTSSISSASDTSSRQHIQVYVDKIEKDEATREERRRLIRKMRSLDVKLTLALNAIVSVRQQLQDLQSVSESFSDPSESGQDNSSCMSLSISELEKSPKNPKKSKGSNHALNGSRISCV